MADQSMLNEVIFGDCRESLRKMAAASMRAQMCVTSPPYFGLRDYGVDGQLGLEATPDEYVTKMVDVFRCVRDVLADDGTLWLNIGDSYNNNPSTSLVPRAQQGNGSGAFQIPGEHQVQARRGKPNKAQPLINAGIKKKDLIGIPWMLAFALRADGWYLRSDVVWSKGNPMPESVTDRPTRSHEYLFLLTKSERYFYDHEAIKEPAVSDHTSGNGFKRDARLSYKDTNGARGSDAEWSNVGGKRNRRSVWNVNTRPYKGAHFAVFPPALVEPCILAGTSERGHCPACGARFERVTEKGEEISVRGGHRSIADVRTRQGSTGTFATGAYFTRQTTGWRPTCDCGVEPIPDVVLDPFMGSGTTAAVAIEHGRGFVGCELNPEYEPLQDERIAAAHEVVRARRDAARQFDMFEAA